MIHTRTYRWILLASLITAMPVLSAGCSGAPGDDVESSSSEVTFANDQTAFDFFVSKGLTEVQAAGIVGNLDQESGDSPTSVQEGGPGRGIAQWSAGGRWDTDGDDNAEWYAEKEGESVDSLQLQLEFIWYELTTYSNYGLASVRDATTITAATVAFETDFEGCGECDQSNRIAYAEAVYDAYAGTSVGSGSGIATDATPCTLDSGETGTCILTSDCSSQGGTSTAGYCPGADDIQCCTGVGSSGLTGLTGSSSGSGTGTSGTTPPPPSGGCYSDTLGKEMPNNACVQSKSDDAWYQCDDGEWTDRWTDSAPCDGTYAL